MYNKFFLCANIFFSIFRSGNPGLVRVYARFLDFQVTRILLDPWIDYNSFVKRRPQFVCKGLSCFYVGTQKGNELGSGLYLIEMKSQRDYKRVYWSLFFKEWFSCLARAVKILAKDRTKWQSIKGAQIQEWTAID